MGPLDSHWHFPEIPEEEAEEVTNILDNLSLERWTYSKEGKTRFSNTQQSAQHFGCQGRKSVNLRRAWITQYYLKTKKQNKKVGGTEKGKNRRERGRQGEVREKRGGGDGGGPEGGKEEEGEEEEGEKEGKKQQPFWNIKNHVSQKEPCQQPPSESPWRPGCGGEEHKDTGQTTL